MELKYLGTAAAEGIPGIFCECVVCREAMKRGGKEIRTRSQALVDKQLLIDFPPDSYWHMVRDGVSLPDLQHVLITHTHTDHFYPDELYYRRKGFCITNRLMTLYGNDALKRRMDRYVQEETGSSYPESRLACEELAAFISRDIAGYTVIALPALHDRRENCFIYMIGRNGKWLLYGNDTGVFPESTWRFIRNHPFDLISLDCTTGKKAEGSNHMGVPDLIGIKQRLTENGCTHDKTVFVATHFSHNGGLLHDELEALLNPHGYLVAYDGLAVLV